MSLLSELTAELSATTDELPLPALRRAVLDVRRANDYLVRAAQSGAALQPSLARLGRASTHLENGAGLLMRAQDEVASYLAAIGGRHSVHRSAIAAAEPTESWWARRIGQLTGESEVATANPARTAPELLVRVGRAVAANDRVGLHRELLGAGAGLGSSLAAAASTVLRQMLDDQGMRPALSLTDLLPGLPEHVTPTLMGSSAPPHGIDSTDRAVGTAVLAGRFAHLLGRTPEQLVHA